jgi:cellulose synthase/poly-beta-1,6-N-acetylglucosamine synthase-like glycosyltransferase
LLDSLRGQDYPNFELVFVDDRSTDGTGAALEAFAASLPSGRVKLVKLDANPGPNFKQYGLGKGIAAAAGEFLLFTDADCAMAPGWIGALAARLADPAVGFAFGPVFKTVPGRRFLDYFQAYDHALRCFYLAAFAGIGQAAGAFGNNMIVRRAALEKIGGYAAVPYSVTEDAALVSALRAGSGLKLRAATEPAARVLTQGEAGWRPYIVQCVRWNNGGLFSPETRTRLGFAALAGMMAIGAFALPASLAFPALWPLWGAMYLAMALSGAGTLRLAGSELPPPRWRYLVCAAFFPYFFTLLTILGVAGMEVRWKGAKLG